MGRYYHGDIEGKFMFAVQSSDDADYFGSTGYRPDELHYNFSTNDIPQIKEGIENCIKALGKHKDSLDSFFQEGVGYNDKMIAEHLKIDVSDVKQILEWYARLELGQKILDCVEKESSCSFVAEL